MVRPPNSVRRECYTQDRNRDAAISGARIGRPRKSRGESAATTPVQEGLMTRTRSAILSAFAFIGSGALLLAQAPPAHPAASNPHLGNRESIRGGMALYRVRCADCH